MMTSMLSEAGCLVHELEVTLVAETGMTVTLLRGEVQSSRESYDDEPRDEIEIYCVTCKQKYHVDHYEDASYWMRFAYDKVYEEVYDVYNPFKHAYEEKERRRRAKTVVMDERAHWLFFQDELLHELVAVLERMQKSWRVWYVSQNLYLVETTDATVAAKVLDGADYVYAEVRPETWMDIGRLVRWHVYEGVEYV